MCCLSRSTGCAWTELLQGEVHIGVRPAMPVTGIDMILANNLAGSRVWKTALSSRVVTESPPAIQEPDDSAKHFPEVFPVCAVTRSMSRTKSKDADV